MSLRFIFPAAVSIKTCAPISIILYVHPSVCPSLCPYAFNKVNIISISLFVRPSLCPSVCLYVLTTYNTFAPKTLCCYFYKPLCPSVCLPIFMNLCIQQGEHHLRVRFYFSRRCLYKPLCQSVCPSLCLYVLNYLCIHSTRSTPSHSRFIFFCVRP